MKSNWLRNCRCFMGKHFDRPISFGFPADHNISHAASSSLDSKAGPGRRIRVASFFSGQRDSDGSAGAGDYDEYLVTRGLTCCVHISFSEACLLGKVNHNWEATSIAAMHVLLRIVAAMPLRWSLRGAGKHGVRASVKCRVPTQDLRARGAARKYSFRVNEFKRKRTAAFPSHPIAGVDTSKDADHDSPVRASRPPAVSRLRASRLFRHG